MSRVLVHLFNLGFQGEPLSDQCDGKSRHTIFHIDLESDLWMVRIRTLGSIFDVQRDLRERGGYRLTHVAEVSRSAGECFSGGEVDEVLAALENFPLVGQGHSVRLGLPDWS